MAVPFLSSIKLNKNQVEDFCIYNLANDPSPTSGADFGYFWLNTGGSKTLRWWDGTTVRTILDSASTISVADNLSGGVAGSLPYQTAVNDTVFLGIGTADQVLKVNSGATAPEWVSQSTLAVGSATNKPGGALGDLLVQSGSGTTTFLNVGTAGQVLTSNGASPAYVNQSSLSVGSATTAATADKVANALTAGTYLTAGGTFDGSTARTFAVDATSANTASKVVARDGSGNFSAGTITASLTGTASNATNVNGGDAGSLLYQTATNFTGALSLGSAGYILRVNTGATAPEWSATIPSSSVSGLAASATTDTTNAANISSGLLPLARLALATGQFYLGDASNNPVATAKTSIPLSGFGAAGADVAMGGFKITGLADPVDATDAANRKYVDEVAQGLDVKASCLTATTTNINLSAPTASIGGVTISTVGSRVLVKDQTDKTQNGIYLWQGASSAMTRSLDADTVAKLVGAFTFVEQGTNADSGWVCQVDSGTIGSVDIEWTKFSQAGSYTAGNGMVLVGGQFSFATSNPYTTGEIPYAYSSNEIRFKSVTGTGDVVLATSPTLVTPALGAATATSINKLTITAPATGSTLTIADGKTLTASNTLTFTGTDSSSVAFGAGGTVAYTGGTLAQFAATTSSQLAGVISDETGTGSLVFATSPTLAGTPLSTTAAADTNTTQIATTAYVVGQASATTPAALGTAAVGTSLKYARADHVHALPTIDLASGVSGTLPVANGGTGAATFTAGQVLFGNGTSAINTSANLFWDNSNSRLGIGTASPSVSLDVNGSAYFRDNSAIVGAGKTLEFISTYPNRTQLYQTAGNNFTFDNISSGGFLFYTNSNLRATLDSSGNLGLGTTPAIKFHVRSDSGAGAVFLRGADPATGVAAAYIQTPVTTGYSETPVYGFWYQNIGISSPAANTLGFVTDSVRRMTLDASGNLLLKTNGTASTPTIANADDTNTGLYWPTDADTLALAVGGSDAVFIDSSRRVGIGTSTPSAGTKLDVRGGQLYLEVSSNQTNSQIALFSNQTTVSNNGVRVAFDAYNIGQSAIGLPSGSASLAFYTNGIADANERLRIKSTGQLNFTGLASAPTGAVGDLYYNNTSNTLQYHNNSAFQQISRKYSTALAGTNTSFTVTHNFGTRDVTVQVRKSGSTYDLVYTDVQMTTENAVTVIFASSVTGSDYTVTVIG